MKVKKPPRVPKELLPALLAEYREYVTRRDAAWEVFMQKDTPETWEAFRGVRDNGPPLYLKYYNHAECEELRIRGIESVLTQMRSTPA